MNAFALYTVTVSDASELLTFLTANTDTKYQSIN